MQIITGEDWELVMADGYTQNGLLGIFYVLSVTLLGQYLVLQMFVAVLTFTLQQVRQCDCARENATVGPDRKTQHHLQPTTTICSDLHRPAILIALSHLPCLADSSPRSSCSAW